MRADGAVETVPDPERVRAAPRRARAQGYDAVAIVFMHAYRYPAHERVVAKIARELGFAQVSESHVASALIKLVSRGDTAVVDAYLSPILARYVGQVSRDLDLQRTGARVMFMMSSGGLTSAGLFAGKDAILSGPAGGVVAMARTGISAGFKRIIGFDMGGTSTDVAHFDGEFERAFETEVAGVRMRAPMMKIHTVAAGGGSILSFDGARFRVGPASAGADPGPAAYRRGGPLTVTDANLMTGKLIPDLFPKVFGPGSDEPLDDTIVRERFAVLARDIGDGRKPEAVADGFLAIAVAKMAEAIKTISVARGYDVTRYALNCFGGAGGQHACDVADALAISTVLIHPFSSLLSAYGMGLADIAAQRARGESTRAFASKRSFGSPPSWISSHARRSPRSKGRESRERRSTPIAARNCVIRAPIRRSRFRSQRQRRCGARSKPPIKAASASLIGTRRSSSRRCRSRPWAARRGWPSGFTQHHRLPRLFPPARRASFRMEAGERRMFSCAKGACRHWRLPSMSPRARREIEPHQTIVVEQGWRAGISSKKPCSDDTRRARAAAPRRSAPGPTRSCSRSSIISSCRSPSRWG